MKGWQKRKKLLFENKEVRNISVKGSYQPRGLFPWICILLALGVGFILSSSISRKAYTTFLSKKNRPYCLLLTVPIA